MLTIGCMIGGAAIGWCAGWLMGAAGGGDFNFAPAIYAPMGGMAGAAIGTIVGVVLS